MEDIEIASPNDTAYKRWIGGHSGYNMLCKLCLNLPHPTIVAQFTVCWASRPCGPAEWLSLLLIKAFGIWFFQFLTNRTHYVKIPGCISKDSPVLSGVPQGTVLGPLLFLIMISDINKGTTSSKLVSFADDTRVYSNIAEADDCDNLQYDLNSIYNWAVHNNMFF